jgi:hypothetical protein
MGHDYLPGVPGTDECVALSHQACPHVVVVASAQLLDLPNAIELTNW